MKFSIFQFFSRFFSKLRTKSFLTYDVTPSYIRRPWVAERIYDTFSNTKLIAVLRNPVDKSYSHYYQSEKYGEKRTFDEVVKQEIEDISGWNSELKDNNYFATKVENSILARCFYAEQLSTWFKIFSKDQIMIIQSEKLASNTEDIMNDVFQFLKLPKFNIPNTKKEL